MRVHLYLKYDDLQNYREGKVVTATDKEGKSPVFKYGTNVLHIDISEREIVDRADLTTRGMSAGTYNLYLIQKETK